MKILFLNVLRFIFLTMVLGVLCTNTLTTLYHFRQPTPFCGNLLYNPYQHWVSNSANKANFHAHSSAWLGLTNGVNSPEKIKNAYTRSGYRFAGISNYQRIENYQMQSSTYVPVYEHGYNLFKTHQLAIGADQASFLEFPFFQSLSQKQTIINDIKSEARFIMMAHPALRNGYTKGDLIHLDNYDFMEVLSPYANSLHLWDVALRSGHRVWCLANDDLHRISTATFGAYYNLISDQATDRKSLYQVLSEGCYCSIFDKTRNTNLNVSYLKTRADSVFFAFTGSVKNVTILSDKMPQKSLDSKGCILFPSESSYLRFEVRDSSGNLLLTNPIIRYDEGKSSSYHNTIDGLGTVIFRILNYALSLIIISICFPRTRSSLTYSLFKGVFRLSLLFPIYIQDQDKHFIDNYFRQNLKF